MQNKWILVFLIGMISCTHLQEDKTTKKHQHPLRRVITGTVNPENINWHLQNTRTEKAWNLSKGDKNTIVAIIDTGIDTNHRDLIPNLWINQKEKQGKKGVDDDNNGFVDDIHGWNFADGNANVSDYHGHGTHVAGIIGGLGNVCPPGVSPKVSLMILKYYNENAQGNENLQNTIASIYYAIRNGAHIINFSGGGEESSEKEREAIEVALENNILFVAAGGNEQSALDKKPYYPASYQLPNIFFCGS